MQPPPFTIATPCPQDWSAMSPVDGGRHCLHCDRVVVDLTACAPSAAAALLTRARQGDALCVRARVTSDRRVLLPASRRRLLTNGIAAVLALSVAGCGTTTDGPATPVSASSAATAPPPAERTLLKPTSIPTPIAEPADIEPIQVPQGSYPALGGIYVPPVPQTNPG